jgi:pimeloyl-ACP methyl ester carboxylesterase
MQDLHRDLARLSSNGTHMIVDNSGHFIQVDEPEVVIHAIRQVVEAVRGKSRS